MKFGSGRPVRIELVKFSYKIRLLIHDQGPGIHLEDTERIFQRFERASNGRDISGLGLGLYISRQIVQDHEGALYVTSKPGTGSSFIMELPI
jgi:signal transduction histidine kinase